MYEIRKEKMALREQYRARRRALPPEEKARRDRRICDSLIALASFRYCDTLLVYAPLADEIDINPVADEALRRGKTVLYPRCAGGGMMTYHAVTDRATLVPGRFGLREPGPEVPVYTGPTEHALCLIPALAFDRAGYRLGYGGGYYDRYLPGFAGTRVGLIYNDFLLRRVPRGRYDLPVGLLVTERGVRVADES